MKTALAPYLNFDGNTAEAMNFYQSIFGGKLTLQTFGEAGAAQTPEQTDRIMHADLKNEALSFMASDGNPEHPVTFGNNVNLSLTGSDMAVLTKYFESLSQGGQIDMPLAKQFWGDTFGMLTDKFGVHWMVNIFKE